MSEQVKNGKYLDIYLNNMYDEVRLIMRAQITGVMRQTKFVVLSIFTNTLKANNTSLIFSP